MYQRSPLKTGNYNNCMYMLMSQQITNKMLKKIMREVVKNKTIEDDNKKSKEKN